MLVNLAETEDITERSIYGNLFTEDKGGWPLQRTATTRFKQVSIGLKTQHLKLWQ